MSNSLSFLGIVRKANKLEIGEESTGAAARGKKAKVILFASDAADNSRRRAEGFSKAGNVPLIILPYTKEEIGTVLDRAGASMAAITDIGLASAFVEKLQQEIPEYEELALELKLKAERAKRRKKKALVGNRKASTGKRRKKV